MLRQVKPKNARTSRILKAQAPLAHENPKVTLLLRGTSSSSLLNSLLTDISSLKKPHIIRFNKKNDIHPFEDASSLEFFSSKNDASLMIFASHSKKRPHCLTWIRFFGGKVLDMLELAADPDSVRSLMQFKCGGVAVGTKPMIAFSGAIWDGVGDGGEAYRMAKNMLLDFFRGEEVKRIDVEGLQMLIHISAGETPSQSQDTEKPKQKIHIRVFKLITKRSTTRIPRIELAEMGPRIDFSIGRLRHPENELWKAALKKSKVGEMKSKKNVDMDGVGDKIGRIHLGRQDLGDLQTRKMKGLKRGRGGEVVGRGEGDEGDEDGSGDEDGIGDGEIDGEALDEEFEAFSDEDEEVEEDGNEKKRMRIA